MLCRWLGSALVFCIVWSPLIQAQNLVGVKDISFFYLGGENVERPATGIYGKITDDIHVNQIAVLHLEPATTNPRAPIIMLPGYGLSSDIYLERVDGRDGWAMQFVRRGYPVYLVEPTHTTVSGIDTGFYLKPKNGTGTHQLFSWGIKQAWTRFGLGPKYGILYSDSRFDRKFYTQFVAGFTGVATDAITGKHMIAYQLKSNVDALAALLKKVGPATILVHSASGVPGFVTAEKYPDLVNAVINVEPIGCPAKHKTALRGVPVLSIFGDHMKTRPQIAARRDECRTMVANVKAEGVPAKFISLPDLGIKGNSHLMMLENNSVQIAGMMLKWLKGIPQKRLKQGR